MFKWAAERATKTCCKWILCSFVINWGCCWFGSFVNEFLIKFWRPASRHFDSLKSVNFVRSSVLLIRSSIANCLATANLGALETIKQIQEFVFRAIAHVKYQRNRHRNARSCWCLSVPLLMILSFIDSCSRNSYSSPQIPFMCIFNTRQSRRAIFVWMCHM